MTTRTRTKVTASGDYCPLYLVHYRGVFIKARASTLHKKHAQYVHLFPSK
jgi:hypothetical protein